ncbi:hypothetical protein Fcan01_00426 [Folsomia candida]|uniref:Uncharacterized protein n=1 Tax=Folsomia candida TaxID=158441 RepID=A0A226F4D2_FOLCA|nr:hypothetical protein Fcan01_00426 [Folsomia candida]
MDHLAPPSPICMALSNPVLCRSITISKGCKRYVNFDDASTASNLIGTLHSRVAEILILTVCNKYSDTIQEITVHCRVAVLPTLYQSLSVYCPQLKRLTVECRPRGMDPALEKLGAPLPVKSKLECIRFIMDDQANPFMQQVLNAAPNLKTLFITGNLYPDLSQNPNLDHLCHIGRGGPSSRGFNGNALSRVISQVANSLTQLKVGFNTYRGKYCPLTGPKEFSLPRNMPQLKILHNRCIDIFKCPDEMGGLIGAVKYQNLDQLIFGRSNAAGKDALDNFLEKLFNCGDVLSRTVKKVVIKDVPESLGLLANLKIVYPAVTELELFFLRDDGITLRGDVNQAVFRSQIQLLLSIRGLTKITLNMTLELSLSGLVKGLADNKYLFKGKELKQLKLLRGSDTDIIVDDLDDAGQTKRFGVGNFIQEFENVLLAMKDLELVEISAVTFRGPTAHRVISFIRDENLPVRFY